MKNLSSNATCLSQYGINYLTGEACAFSMRILCDVSEKGAKLIRDFWGLPYDCPLAPNWNSKVDGEPAIGSVMVPRYMFPELMRFALLSIDNFDYVLTTTDGSMIGLNDEDEECNEYLTHARAYKWEIFTNWRKHQGGPRVGSRNVHAFTGRSV